jgi:hypothetical protein
MCRCLRLVLLVSATWGAPARADECEARAVDIAGKLGLDVGQRTLSDAFPLSARTEEEDDYGAFLLCKSPLGMSLRYLSPPAPGQKWFRFVGRAGAILTGVKPAAIALEAQNCVENARLRKALSFRSPGSAFQMQCSVSRSDDRAEISLAGR